MSRRGALLVAFAAVLWGTTGTAQALGPPDAHPLAVGAVRLVVGALGLLAFVAATGQAREMKALPLRGTIAAAAGIAAYQWTFFAGVRLAGVATGTLVAIGSAPVFVALLAWRRPTRAWIAATGLALVGLVVLAVARGAEPTDRLGFALALGAGASYAVYAVACSRMEAPPDATMAGAFGLGALFLLPALAFVPVGWAASTPGAAMALHLGLVATGLAYLLFGRGLRLVPVTTAGSLSLLEPLTAALLAVVVLEEELPPLGWLGVAILGAGLVAVALQGPKR